MRAKGNSGDIVKRLEDGYIYLGLCIYNRCNVLPTHRSIHCEVDMSSSTTKSIFFIVVLYHHNENYGIILKKQVGLYCLI